MDSNYRPQSPDLSSYAPQSPDLSGFHPQSPDLSALGPSPFGNFGQQAAYSQGSFGQQPQAGRFQGAYTANNGYGIPHQHPHHHQQPTSVPHLPPAAYPHPQQQTYQQQQPQYSHQQPRQQQQHTCYPGGMPAQSNIKPEADAEWLPDAQQTPAKRQRRGVKQEPFYGGQPQPGFNNPSIKSEPLPDPTLGCQLRTSFPVARIKRLMQADEDIGKVAQVTPTVVSRALELFMIKIISASADQARGAGGGGGGGGAGGGGAAASKGPKRILVQHLKKAVLADETFDFLSEIVGKVPDAPAKSAKKENGSDSEDGGSGGKPKKRGKRRKDSTDDM